MNKVSVSVLASGSKGNSIYISDGETAILLDAGLSGIGIRRCMTEKGLDPNSLTAIVVTHEHSDHVKGVGVLSRFFGIPVYMNSRTMKAASCLGELELFVPFEHGILFKIGDFHFESFSVPHDAADPSGFVLTNGNIKIGIAIDLGIVTNLVREKMRKCNLLILEANHDHEMLMSGSYSWRLKQRIRGRHGHLSNGSVAKLIRDVAHDALDHVILAHISIENNSSAKVVDQIGPMLSSCGTCLHIASQESGSSLLYLE